MSGSSQNILTIQTVQIAPFRTLMTALKDILLETNITFTSEGIKIINMDKSHTILAHLFLNSQNFERYDCKRDKIIIGVNMFHLFKLINTIDNDDTLTIYIEEDDYTDGIVQFLGLKFENGDIKQCKTQKLRLIEPDQEELELPEVKFASVLNSILIQSDRSLAWAGVEQFLPHMGLGPCQSHMWPRAQSSRKGQSCPRSKPAPKTCSLIWLRERRPWKR